MGANQTKQVETNNKATILYSNGDRYEGEILDNKRNGFGTYYYNGGERYQGMWENNTKHGRGTMFYQNEEVYEGWWNSNLREGVGTIFYPNGDRYYGEWRENKKNGKGIIHMSDGTKFIGQFKNNKKHGISEVVGLNKEKLTEDWRDGKLYKRYDKPKAIEKADYLKFDPEQLQRFLDSKNVQQQETKSVQVKSKYLSLELAKIMKSKNFDINVLDAKKSLNQDLLIAKPDILQWKVEDVCNWLRNFELEKFNDAVVENNIDGNKLMNYEVNNLITLLAPTEKNDSNMITLCFDLLKKIKKENDQTKSMMSFKSLKKGEHKEKYTNLASTNLKSINYNKKITSIREVEDNLGFENGSFGNLDEKDQDDEYFKGKEAKEVVKQKQTYSPCKCLILTNLYFNLFLFIILCNL